VDNVQQVAPGTISFDWMMDRRPASREASLAIRAALQNPQKTAWQRNNTFAALVFKIFGLPGGACRHFLHVFDDRFGNKSGIKSG
jgi:hypothetical protein